MELSKKLQKLIDKYPDLTGDEIHCANCVNVVWCINDFSQPTSDPEHKETKCESFRFWPRCEVCNKQMVNRSNDEMAWWFCPDHPSAKRRLDKWTKNLLNSLNIKDKKT
jgi:hypothetical protein